VLEFKESAHDKVPKGVAAFASSRGGMILVGVDDQGNIVGVRDWAQDVDRLQNFIHEFIFPVPSFVISVIEIDGMDIISILVEKGDQPAYAFKNQYYYRNGNSSQQMQAYEVQRRFLYADFHMKIQHIHKKIEVSHPNMNVSLGITGRGELATMSYDKLLERLIRDLRAHFSERTGGSLL